MIWSHLQQTLRVDVLLVLSIVVSTALNHCQLLLLAAAGQLDQYQQVPVLPSQTFRSMNCNTCSATTFLLYETYNVLMTRANGILLAVTLGLVSIFNNSQCVSQSAVPGHNLSCQDTDVFSTTC